MIVLTSISQSDSRIISICGMYAAFYQQTYNQKLFTHVRTPLVQHSNDGDSSYLTSPPFTAHCRRSVTAEVRIIKHLNKVKSKRFMSIMWEKKMQMCFSFCFVVCPTIIPVRDMVKITHQDLLETRFQQEQLRQSFSSFLPTELSDLMMWKPKFSLSADICILLHSICLPGFSVLFARSFSADGLFTPAAFYTDRLDRPVFPWATLNSV